MLERTIRLPWPIDLPRTLHGVRRGAHDVTCEFRHDGIWRASRSPAGPSTVQLVPDGDLVLARAWGEGAEAALDVVPNLIGCHDDDEGFSPDHPVIADLWRRHQDVRLPRSGAVTETLLGCILEQRVTTFEARRAHTQIVQTWGEPAPGPTTLLLPPDPEILAGVAYYDLHVAGVEKARADTVRRTAANHRRLDALAQLPAAEAHQRLLRIPGIGPWTAAEVALVAFGDADAVPIGDAHLPRDVTHVLTGQGVDDDEAMLAALAPFDGQRGRVIRLIMTGGLHAPRRGPRYAPRDIRNQ